MAMDNLLQSGGNPDDIVLPSSETDRKNWVEAALSESARKGHKLLLKHMLNTGCDVNAYLGALEDVEDTLTLLHLAILNNQDDVVRFLIEMGADINICSSSSYTTLHFAARADNVDIITLLLDKGMSVNVTGKFDKTPLHSAALRGSIRATEVLCRRGAAIDKIDRSYCTPLIYAAAYGEMEVVRFLVENGADVNVSRGNVGSALCRATKRGQLDLMRYLLDNGADVNGNTDYWIRKPLCIAITHQNLQTVKLLIGRGADVNFSTRQHDSHWPSPLHFPAEYGYVGIMDCLIKAGADVNVQDSDGDTLLFCAVQADETEAAIHLIEKDADVNLCQCGLKGRSPLHEAADNGNLKIMDCLIKAGADMNVLDSDGDTPLFCAVARHKTKAVINLIENGADVNLCGCGSKGRSPLHVAAQHCDLEIIDCLIKAGAHVNVRDSKGATPLFRAVTEDKTEAVFHLVQCGADVNVRKRGFLKKSAIHVAEKHGNQEIMDCLIDAGANLNISCFNC
jgi:ankyrin repeat protein